MKTLRFGVIGTGYWGPNIIRNLSAMPDVALHVLCDKIPERLDLFRQRYPTLSFTTDARNVMKDPLVDAVAIATPVSTHYAIARDALLAGKHVFVEKPITQKGSEARKLAQLAARKKRVLMVDHVFIYSSAVQKIKRLIRTNRLGKIYYFDSVRVNLGIFQKDVNVIWDLAPHDLSIMDYLLDQRPRSISAIATQHIQGSGKEDIAYLTVRYPDRLIAHIHINWLAPAKIRQILIGGAKRMVVYDDSLSAEKIKVYDKGVNAARDARRQVEYRLGDMWAPKLDTEEALANALRHFVLCIRRGKRPWTDGAAGTRVVEMLEAAGLSARARGKEIFL
jgi:predicted dehydrogenase